MRVKENVTVYQCDHCKKRLYRKSAMELHEKLCYSNPNNQRACSSCAYIKEIEIEYESDCRMFGDDYGVIFTTETRKAKTFFCEKLLKKMYAFKAERKGLIDKYPETFEDQEPMPITCEHWTP